MILACRERLVEFPRRPLVMGIVNINADSFSGDGDLDVGRALLQAREMVRQGADIIDVGGESARTNREAISEDEEIDRVLPFIQGFNKITQSEKWDLRDAVQVSPPLLSMNTWRPAVAEALLAEGGDILNDMSALPDDRNARIAAASGAALLIMHSVGEPKVPHRHVLYENVMKVLATFFDEKIALAQSAGLKASQLILDPGIEFAKQLGDNLRIYSELEKLQVHGRPVLLPVSRKSMIGEVLGLTNPADRDAGTVACIARGVQAGAQIFRVHNVDAAFSSIKVLYALESAKSQIPEAV